MTSEIKADKWSPASGTAGTIGDSGDTFTVPSGVTLTTSAATVNLPTSIITGQTEKSTLADADKFLISDSAASGAFKYVQKSNLPSGGLTLVDSGTGSSVTQVNFDSVFTTAYKAYKFVGGFRPATNNEDLWFVLRSGGSNAGASSYRYVITSALANSSGDSDARQNAWGNPYWKVSTQSASNNSSHMQYVDMNFYNPMAASTTFGADNPLISGEVSLYSGSAQIVISNFACMYNSSADYDGLHMTFSSGNINAYNYQVYGFNPS